MLSFRFARPTICLRVGPEQRVVAHEDVNFVIDAEPP